MVTNVVRVVPSCGVDIVVMDFIYPLFDVPSRLLFSKNPVEIADFGTEINLFSYTFAEIWERLGRCFTFRVTMAHAKLKIFTYAFWYRRILKINSNTPKFEIATVGQIH